MDDLKLKGLKDFGTSIQIMEKTIRHRRGNCRDERFIDRLTRAKSWLDRSYRALSEERELEFGFISLWIAFNALYGVAEEEKFEKAMQRFLPTIVDADTKQLRELFNTLRHEEYVKTLLTNTFLVKSNWVDGVYKSRSQRNNDHEIYEACNGHADYKESLPIVLRRIYVLRNQVLHGCSTHSRGTNKGSLIPAVEVLMKLLPCFLNIVVSSEDTRQWGRLPFTRMKRF